MLPAAFTRFCKTARTLICSVGKAPMPTRVVYAFTTPYTSPTCCGGTPSPVHTPPTVQFDEVTKGYVPVGKTQQHSPLSATGGNKDWFFFISSKNVFASMFGLKAKLELQPKREVNSFYYVSFILYNFHRGLLTREKFKSTSILSP